jgi:hypothetical protein
MGLGKFWLLAGAALALAAPQAPLLAQTEPGDYAGDQPPVDPPSRVGRLSYLHGWVSFHSFDADHWDPAQLNYPVTSGEAFWTEPDARARLDIGQAVLTTGGASEVDITLLDDQNFQVVIPQGGVNFHLRALAPGQIYEFTAPGGSVTIAAPGHYHIDAGDTTRASTIAVFDGAAYVQANGQPMPVGPGEITTIAWTGQPWMAQAVQDELDGWSDQAEVPVTAIVAYVPPDMPGAPDLAATGTWQQSPEYGAVWYPPVEADWAPYRYGHWGYVAPWGWTWIDDAPWGFAPFHYGRWALVEGRWGWVPGRVTAAPPVYSPALVAFVGGAGLAVGAAGAVSVGWSPLGPHESYVPPYRTSATYVQNVNITHVTNVTNITNITVNRTVTTYVNAPAATVVSGGAMTGSQPIAQARLNVSAAVLAQATVAPTVAVKPSLATVGASPGVVSAVGGSLAGAPPRAAAPGPAVTPHPVPASFIRNLGGHPPPGAPATPVAAAAVVHAKLPPPPQANGSAHPMQPATAATPPKPVPLPGRPIEPAVGTPPPYPTPPSRPVEPTVGTPPPHPTPPSHPVEPAVGRPPPAPAPTPHEAQPAVAAPHPPAPPHAAPPNAQAHPGKGPEEKEKCDPKAENCAK